MSAEPVLSLLIADDHPLFRMGLRYALKAQGFEVNAEAANGLEAVDACRERHFDVVLLDVKMPDMDGIEACKAIARLDRPPLIVMLTTFEEPAIVRAAADAGASAYLSKETSPDKLASAIRAIVEQPQRNWIPRVEVPDLTPREAQVLELLAVGCSNKEMAKRLDLGPETIEDYLNGVYRKREAPVRAVSCARTEPRPRCQRYVPCLAPR